jgi:DNA helicase II / ATP-dependent DNA helicase PcrA
MTTMSRKIRFDPPSEPLTPKKIEWSEYQQAVFDAVADDGGDLIVTARAGSAKTTTAIEALVYVPENESVLLTAFNKAIEQDLSKRAPEGVEVRTFHAYGLRTIRQRVGNVEIDGNRTRTLCRKLYGDQLTREMTTSLVQAVSACKNLLAGTPGEIEDAVDRMNIDAGVAFPKAKLASTPTRGVQMWLEEEHTKFIKRTGEVLAASRDVDTTIDWDDMIWLPNVLDLRPFEYDRVFVDEAQDTNPAQVEMIERALGRSGRLVSIGDDRQAIYGWRGADLSAMQDADADHLQLPVCYRCGKSIVRLAQQLVPDIQPWSGAPEGNVERRYNEELENLLKPGDFVLSRTNGPLMGLWLRLITMGKPARILGRSAGSGLAAFVKRSQAGTVSQLVAYTDRWLQAEIARLEAANRSTDTARDTAVCVKYLSGGVDSIDLVLRRIDEVFTQNADRPERITLSTVHKAKGLERTRVFLLGRSFCWRPQREEQNIFYVAVTRARQSLTLVGDEDDWSRCVLGLPPRQWSHPFFDVDWDVE